MSKNHACFKMSMENDSMKSVGINFVIRIEYFEPQEIWLLKTNRKIPDIIIDFCPFCGKKLLGIE